MGILRPSLEPFRGQGHVLFEFSIPRLGKRIDVVAIIRHVLFVIEFKVGEKTFSSSASDQIGRVLSGMLTFVSLPMAGNTIRSSVTSGIESTRIRDRCISRTRTEFCLRERVREW